MQQTTDLLNKSLFLCVLFLDQIRCRKEADCDSTLPPGQTKHHHDSPESMVADLERHEMRIAHSRHPTLPQLHRSLSGGQVSEATRYCCSKPV